MFLHIYYIKVINGAELIQRWLIHKTFGCVENAQNLATPKKCGKIKETPFLNNFEAVRELESTGGKSTGICTGCTVAGRHSIAELEVEWKHVIQFIKCKQILCMSHSPRAP